MKAKLIITLSALCFLSSGCAMDRSVWQTSIAQPRQYSNFWDERREQRHFRQVARNELECARATARAEKDDYNCEPFSNDEASGFQDGFVDFVMYGGNGNPPILPPRRYWKLNCQNGDGHKAIQDYFNGFRHGAAAAEASGYRDCVTIQLSDALTKSTLPLYPGQHVHWGYAKRSPTSREEPIRQSSSDQQGITATRLTQSAQSSVSDSPSKDSGANLSAESSRQTARLSVISPADLTGTARSASMNPSWLSGPHFASVASLTTPLINSEYGQVLPASYRQTDSPSFPTFRPASNGEQNAGSPVFQSSAGEHATQTWPVDSPAPVSNSQDAGPGTNPSNPEPQVPLSSSRGQTEFTEPQSFSAPPNVATVPISFSEMGPQIDSNLLDQSIGKHALVVWLTDGSNFTTRPMPTEQVAQESEAGLEQTAMWQAKTMHDSVPQSFDGEHVTLQDAKSIHTEMSSGDTLGLVMIVGAILFMTVIIKLLRHRPNLKTEINSYLIKLRIRAPWSKNQRQLSSPGTTPIVNQLKQVGGQTPGPVRRMPMVALLVIASSLFNGCAALTNPVLNGIPVRRLPTELLSSPKREPLQTIPLSLLRQDQPEDYLLGPGDVVGVFVAGVFPLTLADQPLPSPPVYFPSQIDPTGQGLPPSIGYPVTIRNDGTLTLPLIEPVSLAGLTVEQANQRIRDAYFNKGILQPGREAVLVTLMQPRQIRILVFRQEVGGFSTGGRGDISGNNVKQGTGHLIDLRAYENDVVTALAQTGGLPGLDTFDGVYIFRGGQSNRALVEMLPSVHSSEDLSKLKDLGLKIDYIPTRWPAGEPLPFTAEDVILNKGDVLLLEARDRDIFYTAGLLPAGANLLPRDYDLDVLEAVTQIRGTLINGAFGGNNFTGRLIQQGIGNPNPSALTVVRRTPDGGQIPISVDLNRALKDPRERIIVQPDDLLILQETADEAVARFLGDTFNFNVFTYIYRGSTGVGVTGFNQTPVAR